ncbi:MAG: metallophosphoesterase [Clostridia bacterium]|nr:metallophosphoesterase [Clostridia bacterium]
MEVVIKGILTNFTAFIMSIIITVFPYAGIKAPVVKTLSDDCLLNVEVFSDTHISEKELSRQAFLKWGLKNISKAESQVDAIVLAGDVTDNGDEASLTRYYEIVNKYSPTQIIATSGNHDIGHTGVDSKASISREEAMANFIRYRNEYMGRNDKVNYFSTEINGYKFIVLGDEVVDGGDGDIITMKPEQLDFLDRELADGTKDGKPTFVVCHWPISGINGEKIVWDGMGIKREQYNVQGILEKYDNVFYISGHIHSGIKAKAVEDKYGLSSAEQVNGVTYINLPTYGKINLYGAPWSGLGAQLEVYENEVVFRPRNFITNNWYENAEYHFELVK